jgi:hypothetical protein
MAAGGASFVLFGLTGAMLADAGWKRVGNVISPLAIICWCAAWFRQAIGDEASKWSLHSAGQTFMEWQGMSGDQRRSWHFLREG